MGPLSTELKQTSSVMESEHGSTPTGGLRIHPDSSANGVNLSTSERKLRSSSSNSSSSSPDSPFNNPFEEDEYETKKSSKGTTPAKLHEDAQLPSTYGENNVSGSSIPKDQQSNHELPVSTLPPAVAGDTPQLSLHNTSTTESPPIQAMERSGDSSYRIPSRVFARTPSTTPVEWSAASNESLFSIHMGNMSFIKDPMFWRSGELGLPGEPTTSPRMFKFSPNQPPVNVTTNASKSSEGNVAEAAVETMKEVIRVSAEDKSNEKSYLPASVSGRSDASVRKESAEDKSNENSYLAASISSRSDASGASVKSFAFPILTGDIGKGSSVKRSSSPRVGPEHLQPQKQAQPQPQPQPQPQMQTQPQKQPQTEPEPQPQSKPMTPRPPIARTRWLDYFTCCSFCSS